VKSLLVGSEGTLAVISKIILRLIPLPQYRRLFRLDFDSLGKGAEFINHMIKINIAPAILEFMDESSIKAVYDYLKLPKPGNLKASVLVEIDGNKRDVEERAEQMFRLVKERQVPDYKAAETDAEIEELWSIRRNISPALERFKPDKINEDIVVPIGKIPETVTFINNLSGEYRIQIALFGHFGDGNIHTNIMVDPEDLDEMKRAEMALDKIFRHVISVKGSITGEHGVGLSKKPFMKYQFTDTEMEVFKNIKRAFDPENLLNPGKIF
jgi:glycolate oxidase